jgi:hypothetical protein
MIFSRENIIELLHTNVVTVTFTKVNGEERTMKCTLLGEYVPNAPTTNGKVVVSEEKSASNSTVSAWDIEKNGWRSFRIDSVKSVSVG